MHRHTCDHGCGNYYVCASKLCQKIWVCPECLDLEEMNKLDDYWSSVGYQPDLPHTTLHAKRGPDEPQ